MNNKEALLRKVKELAKNGYGGEKDNAQELLTKLMQKYGISENDLEDNPVINWSIKEPKKGYFSRLFWQLIVLTIDQLNIDRETVLYAKKGGVITFKSPTTLKIDFTETWDFYSYRFTSDLDIFYLAFLQKNQLLTDRKDSQDKPTKKEVDKYMKAKQLAEGLDRHAFYKRIEVSK